MVKKEVEDEKLAAEGAASTGENKESSDKKGKKKDEAKVIFEVGGVCPNCGKRLVTKKVKKLVKAAVPAEWEEKVTFEKDEQKTIPEVVGPRFDQKREKKNGKKD